MIASGVALSGSAIAAEPPPRATVYIRSNASFEVDSIVFETLALVPSLTTTRLPETARREADACGSDLDCLVERLRAIRGELVLIVAVAQRDDQLAVAVEAIDLDAAASIAKHFASFDINTLGPQAALRTGVQGGLAELGHELGGQVRVTSDPPGAIVSIDDEPVGPDGSLVVAAGPKTIRVSLDGHETEERRVEVSKGAAVELTVMLSPAPSIFSSPWLWVGVGAAIAGGTTAVLFATRKDNRTLALEFSMDGR